MSSVCWSGLSLGRIRRCLPRLSWANSACCIRAGGVGVDKPQAFGYFGCAAVEQHPAAFGDDHMVEYAVYVAHLMGGDQNCAVVGHRRYDKFAESAFARYVKAVGGFVKQQQGGVARESEAHEGFFLLTHRQ